jgi:23S rRNA (cytosine1962-C5)-methyltransferase
VDLTQCIRDAWGARSELERDPELDCYRLFHGRSEGCPGLEIDRYGDAVVIVHSPELAPRVGEILESLDQCRRFSIAVARERGGSKPAARGAEPGSSGMDEGRSGADEDRGAIDDGTARPGERRVEPASSRGAIALRGAPPAGPGWVVRERGLRFAIDLLRAGNPGLYLDARPVRDWIRRNAAGRRVLNLFAFSGSLGVAAAVGGARPVVHVDSHGGALAWCRVNAELNQLAIDERDLARMNIYQHIRRAQAGRQRYGGIIVDPPPGPAEPRRKDRTPGLRGTFALVQPAARMLEPGGWLLCFHHRDSRERAAIEEEMAAAAGPVRLELLWWGESGDDFPEPDPRRGLRVSAWIAAGEPPASRGATEPGAKQPCGPRA